MRAVFYQVFYVDYECSVAVLFCVADMSTTSRLIICVVVSTNENAL